MRLCATAKLGFYPAPADAISMIAKRLRAPSGPFSILDPCAGEGAALKQLGQLLGCEEKRLLAVELEDGRAEALKAALPDAKIIAPASIKHVGISPKSLSAVFCNSPFTDSGDGTRLEEQFLDTITPWVKPGGILIFLCPERVAGQRYGIGTELMQKYENITVLPFPAHCRRFNEVAILAVRRDRDAGYPSPGVKLTDEMYAARKGFLYTIPEAESPKTFKRIEWTDDEWRKMLSGSPLRQRFAPGAARPQLSPLRPPLALGLGHVGLLVASGHLDGVVAPDGARPHVVRGTSRKKTVLASVTETENDDGETTVKKVYTERIELIVRTASANGMITTFRDGPATEEEAPASEEQ